MIFLYKLMYKHVLRVYTTCLYCAQAQHNIKASTELILINFSDHHYNHYNRSIIIIIAVLLNITIFEISQQKLNVYQMTTKSFTEVQMTFLNLMYKLDTTSTGLILTNLSDYHLHLINITASFATGICSLFIFDISLICHYEMTNFFHRSRLQ